MHGCIFSWQEIWSQDRGSLEIPGTKKPSEKQTQFSNAFNDHASDVVVLGSGSDEKLDVRHQLLHDLLR